MLGEIDFSKKPYKPNYFLAKPNKEIIAKLPEAYKDSLKLPVNETSELTLAIPYFIDENHVLKRNKHIDMLKENYLIMLKFGKMVSWFTVLSVNEIMDDTSSYKQITAFSLEIELGQRELKGYKAESKGAKTVLNEILADTTWSVGDIDQDFELSKRSFEFLDNKKLGSIYDIANKYNAVALFDTDNQIVNLKKMELFGQYKGLTFSYESLLKGFDKKSDAKELVTRLYLEGKDGLTVNAIHPTGQSYIEDFSYFMYPFHRDENKVVIEHSDYMSDSLCHAILNYQELVEKNKDQFKLLKVARDGYNTTISKKQAELVDLQNQLKVIYNIVDNYQLNTSKIPTMFFENIEYSGLTRIIDFSSLQTMYPYAVMIKIVNASGTQASLNGELKFVPSNTWTLLGKVNNTTTSNVTIAGNGVSSVNIQVTAINQSEYETASNNTAIIERYCPNNKQMQIDIKNAEIAEQSGYLSSIMIQINNLQSLLSSSNNFNFTPEQLIELQRFVKVSTFKDDTYIEAEDLLKAGEEKFKEVRIPLLTADIDVVYFLSVLSEQSKWDKLVLGDDVSVKYERIGVNVKAKIIEINYDFEGERISLTLANVRNDGSADLKLLDELNKSSYTSTTLEANKKDWLKSVTDVSDMSLLFEEFWDKVTNTINMSVNNTVDISNRGILITDPNDPMRFLKMVSGAIGMTKSGGQRYELGITPDGIVAQSLYGQVILGQRLVIGDADGVWLMEGPKTTITDRHGRVAMKLGLYEEEPDLYGMVINRYDGYDINSTLINKVIANSEDGFKIQRWNGYNFDDVFNVDTNGYLYSEDMTAKSLKIIDKDDGLLLDGYNKYMNIGKFTEIITDGKLTALEKLTVLGERTRIISEYAKLLQQANDYKTTSRDDTVRIDIPPFTAAYNALIAYLNPLLSNMNETSTIDRDEFINVFKMYYDQVVAIINGINDSIKYSSVQLGSLYNGTIIDALNGITVTRSDTMYRSIMNATRGFYLQKNTSTAENPIWKDQFWADTQGIVHAEGLKLNNSFFTDGDITGGNIYGSSITLRDAIGGVMKLFPSTGFWAGAENAIDAPSWIKPNGEAIFKKLIVKNGVDGGLMIDSENGFIDMNSWDLKGSGAIDAKLISATMVSAELGYISDIVAKSLSTMTRAAIAGWSNFIEIKDKTIQWITGHVVQDEHTIVNGKPMYWVESSQTGVMTTDVTPWPVYRYVADKDNKKVKMEMGFKGEGSEATPYLRMGEGDNGTGKSGISEVNKYKGGVKYEYGQGNYGKERSIDLKDEGILINSENGKTTISTKDFTVTSDNGAVKIGNINGALFEITPDNVINFKGAKINFDAAEYNFK
ncbi:phage tail protein [Paenibacillus odorifer]|uniref:phage tail protein n=1 Tax=Paenibacillus odorifer TaxID=189426 RepID=UPI00096CBFEC|nr:phage tail protein [Paenibacillus odorifer]OMD75292.1 hypothetical protein BSK50_19015 [Paenibacillus odorifer]